MVEYLSNLKTVLETFEKLKTVFEHLKASRLFIKEIDVHDLVERYFSLEALPSGKISLIGRLSTYSLTNQFPIYTPAHLSGISHSTTREFDIPRKNLLDKVSVEMKVTALNVPSISYQPFQLVDGSKAKLLWLYPEQNKGLVFGAREKVGLKKDSLSDVFKIESEDKPIAVLVPINFPPHYLYKTVKITGRIYTSPLELSAFFLKGVDPFMLQFFGHCFRPFSNQDGMLAIDARPPLGGIQIMANNSNPFKIIYTVQGIVEVAEGINEKYNEGIMVEWTDAIPDRQGSPSAVRYFGDSHHNSAAIISIGETLWQKDDTNLGMAAFKEIDLNSPAYSQAGLTALASNWQIWQKTARKRIRDKFNIEPKIRPVMCSNPIHEKLFHPNGLQVPKSLEEKLMSESPQVRRSIDWLGISVGK